MKYGKLTVLNTFKIKRNTKGYRPIANCICDCGNKTTTQIDNLKSGHTTSCGCERSISNTTHGLSGHPLYSVWESIVDRCCNQNSKAFKYYGGRGIKINNLWRNHPEKFIEWALSNGYSKGLTIERNNVNGDYKPSNCRFIPFCEQAKNTRKTIRLNIDGIIDSQRGHAKRLGIHPATFRYRIKNGFLRIKQ